MRHLARFGLVALSAAALAAPALGQAPPAGKAAGDAKKATGAQAAKQNETLATVNGHKITRADVVDYLGHYQFPGNMGQQQVYDTAINALVNTELLTQFLDRQKVKVSEQDINNTVADITKNLKANNQDLATQMAETRTSMAELRDQIATRLKWSNYVKTRGTDAELRKFADENKDAINGAQVRASHILVRVEPDASAADKEKAKQKLVEIKKDIESGKITFPDAANKYSEDDANVQSKVGGDLGWFPRMGHFIEKFSAAAFGMKKGSISDPVETQFGYHLIQVTDRKEGKPIDLAQSREEVLNMYASDLQEEIIAGERKKAKIETKPMPVNFFEPPADSAVAPAGGGAPPASAAPKAATPK